MEDRDMATAVPDDTVALVPPVDMAPPPEPSEGQESEEESEEEVVPLLAGREKRVNAGSRMQALLDHEVEEDAMFAEEADDHDFHAKDEEDVFDSDFGSTSSEEDDAEDEEAVERAQERAEKKKKASVKAAQRAAHFLPRKMRIAAQAAKPKSGPPNKKRRLSPEETGEITAVDLPATTGTPIDTSSDEEDGRTAFALAARRTTSRAAAISYIEAVDSRLAEEHAARLAAAESGRGRGRGRAPTPKKLTQAERIAEALETEELNKLRLKEFYQREEERRELERRGGLVRRVVTGPKVVWLSRSAGPARSEVVVDVAPPVSTLARPPEHPLDTLARQQTGPDPPLKAIPAPDAPEKREGRTYLILENLPNPTRAQEMGAFFGTHTDWVLARALAERINGNPATLCALTGRRAAYRDPTTGLAYADLAAFQTLKDVLAHRFAWNDELQCFTGAPTHRQEGARSVFERLAARDAEIRRQAAPEPDPEAEAEVEGEVPVKGKKGRVSFGKARAR